jgi:hypothetical protein
MKNSKYIIATLYELLWYLDIAFVAYILKYYVLSPSEKSSAIIFILCYLAFFTLATRQFLMFWKGHFCTGMVVPEKMHASYVSLAFICLFAQALSFIKFKTTVNLVILIFMLFFNVLYLLLTTHYLFLIYFAFNYFLFFFKINYLIELI